MQPKRKGAAAKDKREALPANTTKGKKENETEKMPSPQKETKQVIVKSETLVHDINWNEMSNDQKKFLIDLYTAFAEEVDQKIMGIKQLSKVEEVKVIQEISVKEVKETAKEKDKLKEKKND